MTRIATCGIPWVIAYSLIHDIVAVMSKVTVLGDRGSTPEYSLVEVRLEGVGPKVTNHRSDSYYQCIGGTAVFIIGGRKHLLQEGETVFVPRDVPYQDMSSAGANLEVCTIPPFDQTSVEYV
jgi:mannose-6-phosphate isomerase-like protein (cupin superfamily)